MENSMKITQKTKNRTTIWSRNSTSTSTETVNQKNIYIYVSLLSLHHYLQQPRYGSNLNVYHQINEFKKYYTLTHTYKGRQLSHKKEWNLSGSNTEKLKDTVLSEISQTEKNAYRMISLIHRIYKTKQTNKQNRNRLTDVENKQVAVKQ